jgi:hypothetical protein
MANLDAIINCETNDYTLVATPTALFDAEYFDSLPPVPKELGCTPDFNAYTKKANMPPKTDKPFRTGAGHIHVGWGSDLDPNDYDHYRECIRLVKQLDAALFFSSLLWDADESRRTLYGKVGTFRAKPYGLEYRPLSNAWLNDPELILWVYDATVRATELFFEDVTFYETVEFKELLELYRLGIHMPDDLKKHVAHMANVYGLPFLPRAYGG